MLSLIAACLLLLPFQITGVSPAEGSIGTTLVLDGAGFGAKKPSVRLVDPGTGKKLKLKVLAWSDGQVSARLGKGAPAGLRDVVLHPKSKGAADLVAAGAFTLRAPLPQSVQPLLVEPLQAVTVNGSFFGTKKGKVWVSGKPAKVTAWSDAAIGIVVPKQAPGGLGDVQVKNPVGSVTAASLVAVLTAGTLAGPDFVDVSVDGQVLVGTGTPGVLALQGGTTFLLGASVGPGLLVQLDLPVDIATVPVPITIANDPGGRLAWREGIPLVAASSDTWAAPGPGTIYQVVLMSRDGNRVIGRFEGLLAHAEGDSAVETKTLASGLFLVTVP